MGMVTAPRPVRPPSVEVFRHRRAEGCQEWSALLSEGGLQQVVSALDLRVGCPPRNGEARPASHRRSRGVDRPPAYGRRECAADLSAVSYG